MNSIENGYGSDQKNDYEIQAEPVSHFWEIIEKIIEYNRISQVDISEAPRGQRVVSLYGDSHYCPDIQLTISRKDELEADLKTVRTGEPVRPRFLTQFIVEETDLDFTEPHQGISSNQRITQLLELILSERFSPEKTIVSFAQGNGIWECHIDNGQGKHMVDLTKIVIQTHGNKGWGNPTEIDSPNLRSRGNEVARLMVEHLNLESAEAGTSVRRNATSP